MKPANGAPAAGEVVETITTRRHSSSIPSDPADQPDYWQYVQSLSPSDWKTHMLYLRRIEPQPPITLQRSGDGFFTMPSGVRVASGDQEELEYSISQNYGGGTFRILLKKGSQLWKAANLAIGGAPRSITIPIEQPANGTSGATVTPIAGMDSATAIGIRAIDTIAGSEHQAVNIGLGMMNTAANVVKNFATGGGNAPQDDLSRQFMQVMIARALEDPFEKMVKFMTVMHQLNGATANGTGVTGDLVTRVLSSIVDRGLNGSNGAPPVNAGAELVRQLPQAIGHIAEAVREQRKLAELQLAAARVPQPARPTAGAPALAPPPAPAPTNGAPGMEFVENKIVEIFNRPISAEAAADEVMAFIQELDPTAIAQFAAMGEEGLLQMFGTRPNLKRTTANMPRLVEFIRAFLRMYKEDEQQAQQESAPKTN